MTIQTAHNIGDRVYPIEQIDSITYITCPACDGSGDLAVTGENKKFYTCICPECDGRGETTRKRRSQWHVKEVATITGIVLEIDHQDIEEVYDLDGNYCHYFEATNLFSTQEQAQRECNMLNGSNPL